MEILVRILIYALDHPMNRNRKREFEYILSMRANYQASNQDLSDSGAD